MHLFSSRVTCFPLSMCTGLLIGTSLNQTHMLFHVLLCLLCWLWQQVHPFFYPWTMSDSSTSDGQCSGQGAVMADYIAAKALDSDGKLIQPKQPKKSWAAHHAKHSPTSCKAHSKKLKLDSGIESNDKDDDFKNTSENIWVRGQISRPESSLISLPYMIFPTQHCLVYSPLQYFTQ